MREVRLSRTLLVEQTLAAANDFLSTSDLAEKAGVTVKQCRAALHHLRSYNVVEGSDNLWAVTGKDERRITHEHMSVEDKPRRQRRSRPTQTQNSVGEIPCPCSSL